MNELKPVRGWAVCFFEILHTDLSAWNQAMMYTIFPNKAQAVKWIGGSQSPNAKIVRVLITPQKKKGKE